MLGRNAIQRKVKQMAKSNAWIIILVIIGVIVAMQYFGTPKSTTGDTGGSVGACPYQETGTYATKDIFGTTSVTGTSYLKTDGNPAIAGTPTTSVSQGTDYTYWVDNSTYYVLPVTQKATCGVNPFTAKAWNNASATVTGYDIVGSAAVTSGASNVSMAANANANIRFTYQGTAKKSAAPFGGVMVIEYNSSIASVTCSGANIVGTNPFHLTYTVGSTTRTYAVFAFDNKLDDGTGLAKTIDCQFKNGASAAGAGSAYLVKFIPANYYVANDGTIVLDTEKNANQDTTRTGLNVPTMTAYWGA
jgi:hypothetical protein